MRLPLRSLVFASFLAAGLRVVSGAPAVPVPSPEGLKFFEKEVRPLLAERCYECHGDKKKKGSLRMDHIAYILEGGDSGPAMVPGKPDDSLLIKAVRYTDPDFEMPPKKKLTPAEVAVLEKWVALGAPWPTEEANKIVIDANGFSNEAKAFWSFQPLTNPVVPAGVGDGWARNEIDRFIAKKQAELKLAPSPEADRAEIVRRLYFDLHGLPPTPEQAAAFVGSKDPKAYEKLVDELLASPRYGERWAQHWLDVVRYAESDGYNQDAYRAAAWPYRDWVIDSLNADMPYNQFVREQLAGDEIAPQDPKVMVATGYLRIPIYEYNQRDVRGQWDVIQTDLTDNAGEVFLGLSYGCARCHDHKFDPILQKDYYRLRAFFAPVWWRDDLKLATPEQQSEYVKKGQEWEKATAEIRGQMDALIGDRLVVKGKKAYERFTDDLKAMVDKKVEDRTALERQLAGICERQINRERAKSDARTVLKSEDEKARYQALEEQLKAFDAMKPAPLPEAFVATDATAVAPPVTLKTRKGESEIAPGFLTLLAPGDPKIEPIGQASTGRRLALANWVTRPDNQLATRVIVNRVWSYHFGRGIVGTANDLGKLGERPSHPELLDWMARRFVSEGWSLKKLHREILLSATYRQTAHVPMPEIAAKTDPNNHYLWRFSPQRLDAEQVRDAMLLASGELNPKAGGPSEDGNGTRRSIYTSKKRNSQMEMLRSLDAPAGFASTPERQGTTTPTQALLLLNGEWPQQRAQKLAARVKTVEDAWMLALGRQPTPGEAARAKEFLAKHSAPAPAPAAATPAPAAPATPATPAVATAPVAHDPAHAAEFKENTSQERAIARTTDVEGDEFTVEALVRLDSVDAKAAVRTLVSRWNGAKDNTEAFGWSLGVTGEKSRFKPRNLIVQLVGEDENENITYEVVPSDLRLELGVAYHVAARISCSSHTVTFFLQEAGKPGAPLQTAEKPHPVRAKLSTGASALVVGGLQKRMPQHLWDGRIDAVRVVPGSIAPNDLTENLAQWKSGIIRWNAKLGPGQAFDWFGPEAAPTAAVASTGKGSTSAPTSAPTTGRNSPMMDLCHVLLNTNEFFYLQ